MTITILINKESRTFTMKSGDSRFAEKMGRSEVTGSLSRMYAYMDTVAHEVNNDLHEACLFEID